MSPNVNVAGWSLMFERARSPDTHAALGRASAIGLLPAPDTQPNVFNSASKPALKKMKERLDAKAFDEWQKRLAAQSRR